jgi:DNA-binding transcriptional MerR regulator
VSPARPGSLREAPGAAGPAPPADDEVPRLRIGELAKSAGLTTRTLRYWEEIGLVKPSRHNDSGERLYSPAQLTRVARIRELQDLLGLTLAEIRVVLESEDALERARSAYRAGAPIDRRRALLADAMEANARLIERIDDRLARIAAFRHECSALAERLHARSEELASTV